MIVGKEKIDLYRLCVLRSALKLEIVGLKAKTGTSAYTIIRKELGILGNKKFVLEKLNEVIAQKKQALNITE